MYRLLTSSGRVLVLSVVCTHAFMSAPSVNQNQRSSISTTMTGSTTTTLFIDKKWFTPDNEDEGEKAMVTREMLLRDMLEDPTVKRKRKGGGGGYKPLDNRDHLPFAVKSVTPDPYTNLKIKSANRNRVKSKKTDLDHLLTPSRLYEGKGDSSTLLGEFKLDKSTTSGDVIQIGDRDYRVESARCLYKYAGGKRFVMARKILEVKEVARALTEDLLMLQFQDDGSSSNATDTSAPDLD
jgi:hypothetical protein